MPVPPLLISLNLPDGISKDNVMKLETSPTEIWKGIISESREVGWPTIIPLLAQNT
ncbi:hypothetical protein HanXRQr2_Chr11g0512311 [Helianthus annuus]|uniref:Uncharacterized protein n=1 Tax=Helianthus annuus TaxID=4232 RepID=A0A251TCU8_HELAN|nr:hypothetical protein HanXRQr2_Chr11g0512311 [Helianthus annuus]KAJ0876889.1 hypothetical protein HanPSC8_Chr11g0493621 [Helianthus annuus]